MAVSAASAPSGATTATSLPSLATNKGIEAEQFARCRNLRLHRDRLLVDAETDAGLLRQFVERRGQSAARRVAQQPQARTGGGDYVGDQPV